jgi:hypothetical protein
MARRFPIWAMCISVATVCVSVTVGTGALSAQPVVSATVVSGRSVSVPARVGVGENFDVVASGFAPGGFVEFSVGGATLGWRAADATGVSRLSTSLWASGSYVIEARQDGRGDATSAQISVGQPAVSTTTVPSSSVPTQRRVSGPGSVSVGGEFTFVASGFDPGSFVEFTLGGDTLGWARVSGSGEASVTTSYWTAGSFQVLARQNGLGEAVQAPLTVGSIGTTTTTVGTTTTTVVEAGVDIRVPASVRPGSLFEVRAVNPPADFSAAVFLGATRLDELTSRTEVGRRPGPFGQVEFTFPRGVIAEVSLPQAGSIELTIRGSAQGRPFEVRRVVTVSPQSMKTSLGTAPFPVVYGGGVLTDRYTSFGFFSVYQEDGELCGVRNLDRPSCRTFIETSGELTVSIDGFPGETRQTDDLSPPSGSFGPQVLPFWDDTRTHTVVWSYRSLDGVYADQTGSFCIAVSRGGPTPPAQCPR